MSVASQLLGFITEPLSNIASKWLDRKTNQDTLKSKAVLAKQADATQITLTDAEWETVSKNLENGTWKDEFITLTFMLPIWMIFAGAVYQAFTQEAQLLQGTLAGIEALKVLGLDFGELTLAVVLAGIGLKLWRNK